jgi:SWI/SNF-related matrix-associated actin-dependent regulator 1 of chromatin subfamily A
MELFEYQKEGVKWLCERTRGLLADSMGLGKTVQIIYMLKEKPNRLPALIVCPATLKVNWYREIKLWFNRESQIVEGGKSLTIESDIVIINYDILKKHLQTIVKHNFKTLILDEATAIKNKNAQRTKAALHLTNHIQNIFPITGTPIENRPVEFHNLLSILAPKQFSNFWKYANRYCSPHHNGFGWDFSGASNIEELYSKINNTIMLRRRKEEVLDLPEKLRSILTFPIPKNTIYHKIQREIFTNKPAIVAVNELKQIAGKEKLESLVPWLKDMVETGNKVVVFAVHHNIIDTLYKEFEEVAVKLDGRNNQNQRNEAVDTFQNNDSVKIFIGQIKAAGVGITLTAATHVVFAELDWAPGVHLQAEDRCLRIGQKNNVTCWYTILENTIEEKIVKMLHNKKQIVETITDGKMEEDQTILSAIIQEYTKTPDN